MTDAGRTSGEGWPAALGAWVEEHRRRVVLLWIVIAATSALLLPRFRIDPDLASLLPLDHPDVAALVGVGALDPSSRDLLVVVRDGALLRDRAAFDALVDRVRAAPEVERVAATRSAFGPGGAVAPLWLMDAEGLDALAARLAPEGRRAAIIESRRLLVEDPFLGREVVQGDPLGLRWALDAEAAGPLAARLEPGDERLLLEGGGAALLRVTAAQEPYDQAATARLVRGLELALDGLAHDLVGGHAIAVEDARRIRGDMVRSSVTSAPLVLLFLVLSLGSFGLAHVVLVPVVVAVVGALGLGGALLGPLPALAVASAAILVGLGVDFGLHVATRLAVERGRGARGATARALGESGPAVLAGGATSIAAFLAFAATSIDGLARFGLLLTLGLALALAAALTLVPALGLALAPGRGGPGPVVRAAERLAASRARVPVAGVVAVLAAALGATALVHGVRFDADPGFMRPADSTARRVTERLAGELGFAPAALTVLAPQDAAPRELFTAGATLLESGRAGLVTGAAAAVPDARRAARVDALRAATDGWLEGALVDLDAAGLAAARLRPALEAQAALLARDPADDPVWHIEHAGARWQRSAVHPARPPDGPAERSALRDAVRAAFPAGSLVIDPYGLGDALGPTLLASLERSVGAAALAVALLVLLAVRRPRRALVALVPCVAALAATLGVMALAGWPVHPGNLAALPLVIGLGVDDGLHLVMRHAVSRRGGDYLGATGQAIWRTSVTTAIGFGSLALAATPALASLGAIVLVGTATAFVATVTLVPALLPAQRR